MSINSMLFKSANYNGLLNLMGAKQNYSSQNIKQNLNALNELNLNNSPHLDTVHIALSGVSQRVMSDLNSEISNFSKNNPKISDDFVLFFIDSPTDKNGSQRQVKAYKRSDLIENQGKTEAQKKELETFYKKNPILSYASIKNLPFSTEDEKLKNLSELENKVNDFLSKNNKIINVLTREGYSPFIANKK